MDHNEAMRLQAAVKYVLGELPQDLRDAYEEHYFDCAECALDVRAAAVFSDNARNVLCQAEREASLKATAASVGNRWLAWLKPTVAVPAFAVLLIVVAYQNMVTIPRAKQGAMRGAEQIFTSSFTLQKANMRGGQLRGEGSSVGEEEKVRIHPDEGFELNFDFTPAKAFGSYLCELQDESGRSQVQGVVPGTSTNQEVHFVVRGGQVKPGKYNLIFTGIPGSNGGGTREEVLRLGFSVEFLP